MSEPRKDLPREPARTDAMGPTRVDPSLPGVTGSESIVSTSPDPSAGLSSTTR